jgi:hypothetical protein
MNTLALLFLTVSSSNALPEGLLSAVCYVESKHKVDAVAENDGGTRSHGVCQIKLGMAKAMGFQGTGVELRKPQNNIHYAGKLLEYQIKRCKSVELGVRAYNSGSCKKGSNDYVNKVRTAWQKSI